MLSIFTVDFHQTEDRRLLLQMQKDSAVAFDALYEKYWEQVYSNAYKRLKDRDYAKDITQEIFMNLWSARHSTKIDNLPAYLHTAVRNNVYKWLEREQRYIPIPELLAESGISPDQADKALLNKELLKACENLIKTLTPSQETIFRMRYQQDQSTHEIARELSISRKTVQNQLGRSLAYLRESLLLFFILVVTSFF
jgi:RNA polymerase sigma-70 factor (family 1)